MCRLAQVLSKKCVSGGNTFEYDNESIATPRYQIVLVHTVQYRHFIPAAVSVDEICASTCIHCQETGWKSGVRSCIMSGHLVQKLKWRHCMSKCYSRNDFVSIIFVHCWFIPSPFPFCSSHIFLWCIRCLILLDAILHAINVNQGIYNFYSPPNPLPVHALIVYVQ